MLLLKNEFPRIEPIVGIRMAARIPIMATTDRSSTKVKPRGWGEIKGKRLLRGKRMRIECIVVEFELVKKNGNRVAIQTFE
ncbi:hypothetical protein GCM10007047_20080 [Cerasicoccus arenae]|uniref:Uncharacterized protein n=1 Tax=Cerasicoccus arenae TaxID=424488 RepID=A0A8J3GEG8_9BACT|nr:hypothetical protein GCM10007047_20080 [Cerasicoccus arenae]